MIRSFSLVLITLLVANCSSKKVFSNANASVTENRLLQVRADWLKDKGTKFDIEISVHNISETDVIFLLNEMSCAKGDNSGQLKHTFFNTGERTIDLRRGQVKRFKMVCDIGVKTPGDYTIGIGRVFDNPTGDGATKGNVLTEKIAWVGKS
jgi:hypothetical protein